MTVIAVLNNTLRQSDSELLKYLQKSARPICLVLLAVGGDRKRRCDVELARRLKWADVIHWVESATEFPEIPGAEAIAFQDIPEIRTTVSKLARRLRVELVPFADFIAVDETMFSPVFSVFWERTRGKFHKPRGAIRLKPESFVRLRGVPTVADADIGAISLPKTKTVVKNFATKVHDGYGETRNNFGALFDYDQPCSSFFSLYLSSGALTVRQLAVAADNEEYLRELAWNQYCVFFVRAFPKSLTAEYGIYDRRRRWASKVVQKKIRQQVESATTDQPLINAVVVQLKATGWVCNRLRMIFANYLSQSGLPWIVGARFFARHLVDYFESANVFGWQFSYNLTLGRPHDFSIPRQQRKFDPDGAYVDKWLNSDEARADG